MITARDLHPLVESPEFTRLLEQSADDRNSTAYRLLKGIERFSRGVTRKEEHSQRPAALARQTSVTKASVNNPRQSSAQGEIDDGHAQHVSV